MTAIILSTSDVYHHYPAKGKPDIAFRGMHGKPYYSTGILEKALNLGLTVHIVTSQDRVFPAAGHWILGQMIQHPGEHRIHTTPTWSSMMVAMRHRCRGLLSVDVQDFCKVLPIMDVFSLYAVQWPNRFVARRAQGVTLSEANSPHNLRLRLRRMEYTDTDEKDAIEDDIQYMSASAPAHGVRGIFSKLSDGAIIERHDLNAMKEK
jgi:hypothetical protein